MNNSFYLFCTEIRMVGGHYLKIKAEVCLVFDWALAVLEFFLRALNNYTGCLMFFKGLSFWLFFFPSHIFIQETSLIFFLFLESIRFHFCIAYNRFLLYSNFPVSIVLAYVCLYAMCTQTHTYYIPLTITMKIRKCLHV